MHLPVYLSFLLSSVNCRGEVSLLLSGSCPSTWTLELCSFPFQSLTFFLDLTSLASSPSFFLAIFSRQNCTSNSFYFVFKPCQFVFFSSVSLLQFGNHWLLDFENIPLSSSHLIFRAFNSSCYVLVLEKTFLTSMNLFSTETIFDTIHLTHNFSVSASFICWVDAVPPWLMFPLYS